MATLLAFDSRAKETLHQYLRLVGYVT